MTREEIKRNRLRCFEHVKILSEFSIVKKNTTVGMKKKKQEEDRLIYFNVTAGFKKRTIAETKKKFTQLTI